MLTVRALCRVLVRVVSSALIVIALRLRGGVVCFSGSFIPASPTGYLSLLSPPSLFAVSSLQLHCLYFHWFYLGQGTSYPLSQVFLFFSRTDRLLPFFTVFLGWGASCLCHGVSRLDRLLPFFMGFPSWCHPPPVFFLGFARPGCRLPFLRHCY